MPSSPVLDIEKLLAPIPGENAAGDGRAYAYRIRGEVEELRSEERPEDFDATTRPAVLKRADWPKLVERTKQALEDESKDLRIVCHLIEGLLKVHGFAGLRDGLTLLRRLLDECWDRLHPSIEDGDLDNRAAPLANMLDDAERGIRLPLSVRAAPVIGTGDDACSLLEWKRLRRQADDGAQEALSKALESSDASLLKCRVEDCDACLDELRQLVAVMDARLGSDAPALLTLGAAVSDCRQLLESELPSLLPSHEEVAAGCEAAGSAGGSMASMGATATRSEIYSQLNQAAEMLQQLEPHSPIPYLVKRAVELGRLPFPRLVKQLIRDASVLEELNREMGIKETSEEEAAVG